MNIPQSKNMNAEASRSVKEIVAKNPEGIIARAYAFAQESHAGQKRKTDEPYFTHVLQTAEILNEWGLDEATIAAGLLHDAAEDTSATIEDLKKKFGDEVAFLVDGVTKLGRIKFRGTEAHVENLRKMIIALSEDLRVIFVKLADRLHNMRTLGALPKEKQSRIALETDEIYAPLAYRLGMQHVSGELHDLAFPYLYPKEYEWLSKTAIEHYEARRKYLEALKPTIEETLGHEGLKPLVIDFRAKRISSLYHKLLRHDMDLEKIYDLVAMRIIMETPSDCYATLGLIHKLWPPLPGRIKDYIAMPKPNGYRSLHTTIIGPGKKIVEFQIRTKEMHNEAENGIAAHWAYKQKGKTSDIGWVAELRKWQEAREMGEENAEEFLEAMKVDFFKDRIFVITPKGEVIDLPANATPVDFAYRVHSDVGNSCVGARVNQRIVPLNYELHSGDMVEIVTQKNKKPSEDWLAFVKTASARDRIRAALRKKTSLVSRHIATKSEVKIIAKDRVGLLRDVAGIVSRSHVNILHASIRTQERGGFSVYIIQCETAEKKKMDGLLLKLKRMPEVKEVSYKLL